MKKTAKRQGTLLIAGRSVAYTLSQRRGTKRLSVTVRNGSEILISAPLRLTDEKIAHFIAERSAWINKALLDIERRPERLLSKGTRADFLAHKTAAQALALERLAHYNKVYGYDYGPVMIRDQKTRWGSCSPSGTLSFNYRLVLLPRRLADYLIVHELCHIGQMNHSSKFWSLVAKTIPDYEACRRELRHLI